LHRYEQKHLKVLYCHGAWRWDVNRQAVAKQQWGLEVVSTWR